MSNRIEINQTAPGFTLKDFKRQRIQLSDFQNKKNVLLIHYGKNMSDIPTNEEILLPLETLNKESHDIN